jgi:hypothetical protein
MCTCLCARWRRGGTAPTSSSSGVPGQRTAYVLGVPVTAAGVAGFRRTSSTHSDLGSVGSVDSCDSNAVPAAVGREAVGLGDFGHRLKRE